MISLAESTTEKFSLQTTPNILLVPHTDEPNFNEEYFGFSPFLMSRQIEINLQIINSLPLEKIDPEDQSRFANLRQLLNKLWDEYRDIIADIANSAQGVDSVANFLTSQQIPVIFPECTTSLGHLRVDRLEQFFKSQLSLASGNVVAISESHATTTPLIRVLKERNPIAKIAMVVFDTHVDTGLGPNTNAPRKTNTLRLLVEKKNGQRTVERILSIGQPDFLFELQQGQSSDPANHKGRIRVVTEEELYGANPYQLSFSHETIDRILEQELKTMKRKGITHLLTSFDIDVLRSRAMKYTAMEYNSFHLLLCFSQYLLPFIRNESPQQIYEALVYDAFQGTPLGAPIAYGGRGLSLSYVQHAFQQVNRLCENLGIQRYLPFDNTKVFGDVVELSGHDYQDRTKKAMLQVARFSVDSWRS